MNNKIIREPINMEKLKKAQIEEKEEDIKDLKKELADFSEHTLPTEKVLGTSVEVSEKVLLEKVKKLKCDFKTFKTERNKSEMRVPEKCEICGKSFEKDDNIYAAFGKDLSEIFICKECAEKD